MVSVSTWMKCLGMDEMGPWRSCQELELQLIIAVVWTQRQMLYVRDFIFARGDFEPVFMMHGRNEANGGPGDVKRLHISHGPHLSCPLQWEHSGQGVPVLCATLPIDFIHSLRYCVLQISHCMLPEKIGLDRLGNWSHPLIYSASEVRSGKE